MSNPFFDHPILNSPYERPLRHWELDKQGQPTQQILKSRRLAEYITPIPKPRKRKAPPTQESIVFDEGKGLSTKEQGYDPTPIINLLRGHVDNWRSIPSPSDWQVTPETARLLQHWRQHKFNNVRPFSCQVGAVETAIWVTEVAPKIGKVGKTREPPSTWLRSSSESPPRARISTAPLSGSRTVTQRLTTRCHGCCGYSVPPSVLARRRTSS